MKKPTFEKFKFVTFDIESCGFDNFLIGGAFDGHLYYDTGTKGTVKNLMDIMYDSFKDIDVYYAHFGGIFDFIHLFSYFADHGLLKDIEDIIMQGSKILKFSLQYRKKKMTFIDTSGLFPFSLEKLTKSFGVEHEKIKFDVSNLTKVTKDLKHYLKSDCVGLWECLDKFSGQEFIKDIPYQLTRSGVSFKVYTKFFKSEKSLPKHSDKVSLFCRKAYFGGRVEIFKPLFFNKEARDMFKKDKSIEAKKVLKFIDKNHKLDEGQLFAYDINSLYPSVMFENDFPGGVDFYSTTYVKGRMGIYEMTFKCPDHLDIPLLGISHEGKFIFPKGIIKGHFCSPEIDKALSLGYEIIDVDKGIIFKNAGKIFGSFVNHFYTARINTDDAVKKIIFKDLLNHLYGRMGINKIRDQVSFVPSDDCKIVSEFKLGDKFLRLYSSKNEVKLYSCPAIAAFVTSYARLKLYSFFEQVGFKNCYYCDTDSLRTTKEIISDSKKLGAMKQEDIFNAACFLLPKSYKTINTQKIAEIKLKGIPKKSINHIDFSDFIESISGEVRLPEFKIKQSLAKIKTAFKKGKIIHVLGESKKSISKKYDKRIIIKKGGRYDTEAIKI